jgi:hypothetical protein
LQDLKESGYEGGISIEPHLAAVFHDTDSKNQTDEDPKDIYIRYGRELMSILDSIGYQYVPYSS